MNLGFIDNMGFAALIVAGITGSFGGTEQQKEKMIKNYTQFFFVFFTRCFYFQLKMFFPDKSELFTTKAIVVNNKRKIFS